ncbi:MAG: 5'-nucleotidase, partial [Elainellaceae cyanobacterium]
MKTSLVRSAESTLQLDEFTATTDDATDNLDGVIFGTTTVFIEGRSTQFRTESTTLGVLSAEANRFAAQRIDSTVNISITHAGSITSSIGVVGDDDSLLPTQANLEVGKLDGQISQLDIQTALSSNYSLVLLSLTREEIVQVIEHGISASGGDTLSDRFPQLTGLTFSYDVTLPPGQRVRSLAVTDTEGNIADVIVRDGVFQASSSQTTYRIVTTDFLADGGEGYSFPDAATSNRVNLTEVDTTVNIENNVATFAAFGSQQDAFAEYLAANFNATPFSVEETSIEQDVTIQNLSFRSDTVVDIDVNTFNLVGTAKG